MGQARAAAYLARQGKIIESKALYSKWFKIYEQSFCNCQDSLVHSSLSSFVDYFIH